MKDGLDESNHKYDAWLKSCFKRSISGESAAKELNKLCYNNPKLVGSAVSMLGKVYGEYMNKNNFTLDKKAFSEIDKYIGGGINSLDLSTITSEDLDDLAYSVKVFEKMLKFNLSQQQEKTFANNVVSSRYVLQNSKLYNDGKEGNLIDAIDRQVDQEDCGLPKIVVTYIYYTAALLINMFYEKLSEAKIDIELLYPSFRGHGTCGYNFYVKDANVQILHDNMTVSEVQKVSDYIINNKDIDFQELFDNQFFFCAFDLRYFDNILLLLEAIVNK